MSDKFYLEAFEYNCYNKNYEAAIQDLIKLVRLLDIHLGALGPEIIFQAPSNLTEEDRISNFVGRACSAISAVFSDSNLSISEFGITQLLSLHRWLMALFSATPLVNTDYIIRAYSSKAPDTTQNVLSIDKNLNINTKDITKLCILYSKDSDIPVELDLIWKISPTLVTGLCLSLLSSRFQGSRSAHYKREVILPWLSDKLNTIDGDDLKKLPLGIIHDVYMHCSYADRSDKHDIKKSINNVIRNLLSEAGPIKYEIGQQDKLSRLRQAGKPKMLVVLEWFNRGHSIYRTHSRTIEACRKKFSTIGVGYKGCVDETGMAIFDKFYQLENKNIYDEIEQIAKIAIENQVAIIYMPSIGMFQLTIFLSNLRLAPIQLIALGHPATTHSDKIDFVIVEEDYIDSETHRFFSEKLLILPKDGMPYRPSEISTFEYPPQTNSHNTKFEEVINICVAATIMKLNPGFLEVCSEIARRAKTKVHFHFLVGQAIGLTYIQVKRIVHHFLQDNATVHHHQNYSDYMKKIFNMQMFLNPFPFGNTNGIVDTVSCGLVGICKTGHEVHEHIDEGMFKRLNFPGWMITHSNEKYIESALRLIDNHKERNRLRHELAGPDKVTKLFTGRPEIMGDLILNEYNKLKSNL